MKCLCCNNEIVNPTSKEKFFSWHHKCIRHFFGSEDLPNLDLSENNIISLANKNIKNGLTVTGVQKKLSLHLSSQNKKTLTLIGYPTGYILKPQSEDYKFLPENEFLIMSMAKTISIKTVPFALIKTNDNNFAYITKRIDRVNNKKLAMEDFCQLDLRLTEDKYKGSYERCAKIIQKYSSQIQFDTSELYLRIIFSFLIGNSDMHLKNFSLISDDNIKYHLSMAYDLLSVKLVLDNDNEDLALTLNEKNRNLKRNDFIKFGLTIGLTKEAAQKMINNLISKIPEFFKLIDQSYLSKELKDKLISLIKNNGELLK